MFLKNYGGEKMIEWLKDKFSSVIAFFFVMTIIIPGVAGAIIGYGIGDGIGCIVGILIGVLIGVFLGILTFGFIATVINISDNCDYILIKTEAIRVLLEKNTTTNSSNVVNSTASQTTTNTDNVWVCTNCGTTNPAGTRFCKSCGK